jgi:hypothetical protein
LLSRRSRRYLRQSPDRDGKGEHPHRYSVHGSHLLGRCHGRLQATSPTRYRPTHSRWRGRVGESFWGRRRGGGGRPPPGGGAQAKEAADDGGRQQEDDDGKLLAVGSADKTIRLWSIPNPARPVQVGAPLIGPAGYVWGLAFSPDGTTMAAGVTDGTGWLWDVSPGAAEAQVCANLGQPLTRAEWNVYVPGVPYRAPCS